MLASRLVLLALIAPGIMMADLCRPNDVCTYSITGTVLIRRPRPHGRHQHYMEPDVSILSAGDDQCRA